MARKTSPRGRKPKPAAQRRRKQIIVRVTDAEREAIQRAAEAASRSVADYLVVQALGRRFGTA